MAITPRCSSDGNPATVASISPALTGWTNLGLGVSGTAPATGDFVTITGTINGASKTVTQTAGTGTWTIKYTDNNSGEALTVFVAYRAFTGGETAPTFGWTGSADTAYNLIAVTPDSGNTISVDVWATSQIDTTASTTHTPNPATAAGSGEVSLIMAGAAGTGTTSNVTMTTPSGWTLAGSVAEIGSPSVAESSGLWFKTGVSGTVTPGAMTIEGGTSSTGPTVANLYHVLLTEATPPPVITYIAGTNGNQASGTTQAQTFPTGWQAGDIAVAINTVNGNADTFSQSAGSTFTGLGTAGALQSDSNGAGNMTACVSWRVLQTGDTAPTFSVATSNRASWALMVLRPGTGYTISIDTTAGPSFPSSAGTTKQPPSATAAGTGEASVVIAALHATSNGTTAITWTPPSGWTSAELGSEAGGSSTPSAAAGLSYQIGVGSGSVAPGTLSTNVSCNTVGGTYQLLIKQTKPATKRGHPLIIRQAVMRASLW